MPEWITKLARRLMALTPGRYQIILTIGQGDHDWTVTEMGKVERAGQAATMPNKVSPNRELYRTGAKHPGR